MKKTLLILASTTSLLAAIGAQAWSSSVPTGDFGASVETQPTQNLQLASSYDDDDDHDDGHRRGKSRSHGYDDDDDHGRRGHSCDDDDDDDDDCGGASNSPARAGTMAPPNNGLFNPDAPNATVN